jgi:hypothetical protein
MAEGVKFSGKKFAQALDRIVSDPKLRKALRSRPAETLPQIGIEIRDKDKARLVAKRLAHAGERHSMIRAGAELPNGPTVVSAVTSFTVTTVEVEVEVDTGVVILVLDCAHDREIGVAVEEIQKANVKKMRKALSRRR